MHLQDNYSIYSIFSHCDIALDQIVKRQHYANPHMVAIIVGVFQENRLKIVGVAQRYVDVLFLAAATLTLMTSQNPSDMCCRT